MAEVRRRGTYAAFLSSGGRLARGPTRSSVVRRLNRLIVLALLALAPWFALAITSSASAQSEQRVPAAVEAEIVEAFSRRDYEEALRLIDRAIARTPADSYLYYNRACAYALSGRPDEAAASLLDAVRRGFRDFAHMERDPDLESVRNHETYRAILEARRRIDRDAAQEQLEAWRRTYGERNYRYESDEAHRLLFATAIDEMAHNEMRRTLARQADEMSRSLFGGPPDYNVLIAVPSSEDARKFFRDLGRRDATFDSPNVAGIYEHRYRRLVSTDIGASLRHEFAHVMHYGHMERLGQAHPLWIQEGLACLYEDYEFGADGAIRFLPNERHNVIRGLVRGGKAMPWKDLFTMPSERFMERAQATYPQVRSIFEFIASRGLLDEWYGHLCATFSTSPEGIAAFERTFSQPLESTEREWRAWVSTSDRVDRTVSTGDASLGVAVEDMNDGARVTEVLRGSAAAEAGIRRGDIIVSVAGRTTSSAAELTAAVAAMSVGDRVEVRVRRRGRYLTFYPTLQPLPPTPISAQ